MAYYLIMKVPRRGETFVTRKITIGASKIKLGLQDKLSLGNLDAKRDWGYAPEYCEGMWKILQNNKADDFVLATGKFHSVREFVELSFYNLGIDIIWKGNGLEEKGIDKKSGRVIVEINPKYFRPTEVESLLGDYSKAKAILKWEPKTTFKDLVKLMIDSDLSSLQINDYK